VVSILTGTILIITGFLLILLSVVIITRHKGSRISCLLLAGFLLIKTFLITRWSVYNFDIIQFENSRFFNFITIACFFLLTPLMYIYVKSIYYKPYGLIPNDLSIQLKLPGWQITYAINHSANKIFFNFINSYRVNEAQKRLKENKDEKETTLKILYDVGFNSNSTFIDMIKKFTGKTLHVYRLGYLE